jgi:cytoskeleton protein RodZ
MSETIGQQLKQAREARSLTFSKITQATHIQARLIEAMEADDFESMPSPVQARAFLRLYVEFLGLSLDDLIARQRSGIEGSLVASQTIQPIADQLPLVEAASVASDAARPVSEPKPIKLPLMIREKIRGLTFGIHRSLARSKKTATVIEPVEQNLPSKPEPEIQSPVKPLEEKVVVPGQDKAKELHPVNNGLAAQQESQAVFTNIGAALLQRRETLSLTLEEIEHHTHVRKHYLQALEAGDFDHLPSSVQTRGMLSNYARFLDMDVDTLLLQFAEGLQIQRSERQPVPVANSPTSKVRRLPNLNLPPGLRGYLSLDVFVGIGLIVILLGLAIWGTNRIIGLRAVITPQTTAPSISDILVAAPEAGTATLVPTNSAGIGAVIPEVSTTVVVTIPAAGQGPVQVVLVALQQAFVRVTVDGKILFDGRLVAGTAYPFDGNSQVEVLTGNGAAVSILFNQSDLGPMGTFGEVVDRIYTANAILNPTATQTPTATITPIPSATPRQSPTLRPSSTPLNPVATQAKN